MIDRTIADKHGWLSRHEFDGMTRAVQSFLADTAEEVAHVHARVAVLVGRSHAGFGRRRAGACRRGERREEDGEAFDRLSRDRFVRRCAPRHGPLCSFNHAHNHACPLPDLFAVHCAQGRVEQRDCYDMGAEDMTPGTRGIFESCTA